DGVIACAIRSIIVALAAAPAPAVCSYPDCKCPFDAPADPNWCARGLPKAKPEQGAGLPEEHWPYTYIMPHSGREFVPKDHAERKLALARQQSRVVDASMLRRCWQSLEILKGSRHPFGEVYDHPQGGFVRWADVEKFLAA